MPKDEEATDQTYRLLKVEYSMVQRCWAQQPEKALPGYIISLAPIEAQTFQLILHDWYLSPPPVHMFSLNFMFFPCVED